MILSKIEAISNKSALPIVPGFLPKIVLSQSGGPVGPECQIEAFNDLQAAYQWVNSYKDQPKTWKAYRREWNVYCCGVLMSEVYV